MRISDWSSDVCSSDLHPPRFPWRLPGAGCVIDQSHLRRSVHRFRDLQQIDRWKQLQLPSHVHVDDNGEVGHLRDRQFAGADTIDQDLLRLLAGKASHRSEEHTSELQSLMRISYAV